MLPPMRASHALTLCSIAILAAGCASEGPEASAPEASAAMAEPAVAEATSEQAAPAAAPAPDAAAPTTGDRFADAPARDGKAHRWELRAFADNHVEVWMDSEPVPAERIVRDGNRVAVVDAGGTVIERLDMPASWTPQHGAPEAAGTYRTLDGKVLVPPATMLGGRLEPIPAAALAHLNAAHTEADGSHCAYVANVIAGLPLDQAGVQAHDVIVAVNGSPNASPEEVRAVVRAAKPGDVISFVVLRAGQRRDAAVTLAAWDPKHMVRQVGEVAPQVPATASTEPLPAAAAPAAPAAAPSDELAAARKRIAELEQQVRKEDAVHRAIRPQPAPQPNAGK